MTGKGFRLPSQTTRLVSRIESAASVLCFALGDAWAAHECPPSPQGLRMSEALERHARTVELRFKIWNRAQDLISTAEFLVDPMPREDEIAALARAISLEAATAVGMPTEAIGALERVAPPLSLRKDLVRQRVQEIVACLAGLTPNEQAQALTDAIRQVDADVHL